ncbi:MAG: secreted PhoX family phosphatase [Saprospiraceae bacterium]|jgi:secreted PhoX family phosphatase
MQKKLTSLFALVFLCLGVNAQTIFDEEILMPDSFVPVEVLLPPSPLSMQVLFIGGTDIVQTTATYGNEAGQTVAKEWNDFIGFTPDETGESLGWVSVNHERISADDMIGDGGGMTVFRVVRDEDTDSLMVLDQTLEDGREGKFFNVDFVNTVGETGMNCGGICSMVDGRIWTAEEWFRTSNSSIYDDGAGVRDTADWTVQSDIPGWNGVTLEKYQNFNYMTEIDPRQAVAIRKQYNWGRQPFEGGAVAPDNRIVYLGPDATPGFFGMFVANTPGDFTRGTLFAYKHDKPGWKWVPIWEDGSMLDHANFSIQKGATMFNRIEWVTIDPKDNFVYFTATGRDNPGTRWDDAAENGGVFHPATIARAQAQGFDSPTDPDYKDYYGRIWKYNPMTSEISVHIEGGPYFEESPELADYPEKHLTNPDGLSTMQIDGRTFLVIQEDLNGTSNGRTPAGVSNRTCEMYLLDLSIENPSINDLIRLTAVPKGAEITGAIQSPDGNSLLINAQHPSTDNPFPFNHSLTFAIHGFNDIELDAEAALRSPFDEVEVGGTDSFKVYPNPTTRTVFMNKVTDVALYDVTGKRVKVQRNVSELDVTGLATGTYFLQNAEGETLKLIVK